MGLESPDPHARVVAAGVRTFYVWVVSDGESSDGYWSAAQLERELQRFEHALRRAGLPETSIRTYVGRSQIFVRRLQGDYQPPDPIGKDWVLAMSGSDWVGLTVAILLVFVLPALRRSTRPSPASDEELARNLKAGDWRADVLQPLSQRPGKAKAAFWTLLMPWLTIPFWIVGLAIRGVAKVAARRSLLAEAAQTSAETERIRAQNDEESDNWDVG
jgi:heme exporter protein D